MKATVVFGNPQMRRFAAEIEETGEFVIFDLWELSGLERGDEIKHKDFYSLGTETYYNQSQQEHIEVCAEEVCTLAMVRKWLFPK